MNFLDTTIALADIQNIRLKVVGSFSGYSRFPKEKHFWNKKIPRESRDRITGSITSISKLGLKAWEIVRLLRLGVYDVAHIPTTFIPEAHAVISSIGSTQSKSLFERKLVHHIPLLKKEIEELYNITILGQEVDEALEFWCKDRFPVNSIKGKLVRVSPVVGELASLNALGIKPFYVNAIDVAQYTRKFSFDCFLDTQSTIKNRQWNNLFSFNPGIEVSYITYLTVISNKQWNSFNKDTKEFFKREVKDFENEVRRECSANLTSCEKRSITDIRRLNLSLNSLLSICPNCGAGTKLCSKKLCPRSCNEKCDMEKGNYCCKKAIMPMPPK